MKTYTIYECKVNKFDTQPKIKVIPFSNIIVEDSLQFF